MDFLNVIGAFIVMGFAVSFALLLLAIAVAGLLSLLHCIKDNTE